MSDQQIKSLQCAAIETQAYYDVYWQIPSKQAAAYNMLLDKFNSLKAKIEADFDFIPLHPQILEMINYFNQTETSQIPQIKDTDQTLFLGPPSRDPSQHYNRSIQRICSQLLNENLLEDLADFTVEKQVFQNLNYILKCKGLTTVNIQPITIQVLNNYPLWFSEGLVKTLEAYQRGNLVPTEIDYLTEQQIKFIHSSLKYKDSKIKQKNSNRSKNDQNTISPPNNLPNIRYSEMDTQQSQSQQNFYSNQTKPRTKSILVSNWFHFKTYTNLRPRDTPNQIKRHKAVSCSQVDLQAPFSPQKQSPYNLKASVKPRWFEHIYQK
ncbi:unnamed protein product [Paramecium pentaurelia]|uniref:Uncharacterized protein n=1 Tax=Paramecium pentaurelia TaxID=43138 RepID=A0A8S1VVT2_9CILI|nr:unnamed protein product [Paramecium pentaurelia]